MHSEVALKLQNGIVMKKLHLILLAATISSLIACTKSGDLDLNLDNYIFDLQFNFTLRSHFDSVGIKYMTVPVGRTFQYRDSSTNNLILVKTSRSDTSAIKINHPTNNNIYVDKYTFELKQLTNLTSGPIWYSAESITDTNLNSVIDLYDSEFELTNIKAKVPTFWYPFNSSYKKEYTLLTNYSIEGKSYSEVHLFHASNSLLITDPAYLESWYYWVKGIGIVERRIVSGTSIKTEFMMKYY